MLRPNWNIAMCKVEGPSLVVSGLHSGVLSRLKNFQQVAILVLLCCTPIASRPLRMSGGITAELVLAVEEHFRAAGAYLLYTQQEGKENEATMFQLHKRLSTSGVLTASLSTETLISNREQLPRNRHLYVLLNVTSASMSKVSLNVTMADPVWLLMTSDQEDFFSGVHVPFDCQFLVAQRSSQDSVSLTEVYRVAEGLSLQRNAFGRFSLQDGLTGPRLSLYNRRSDLQGIQLLAGAVQDPPLFSMRNESNVTKIGGFFGKTWQMFEKRMNFRTRIVVPPGGGLWSEKVGMLFRREIDVSASEMSMTPMRAAKIDFATPLMKSKYFIYMKQPEGLAMVWDVYFRPFSLLLWLTLGGVILILAASIKVHARALQYSYFHIVLDVFGGVFCMQAQHIPATGAVRIILFLTYCTGLVIFAAYSGAFTSFLAVRKWSLPFRTLQGLRDDGSYQLGVARDSEEHIIFKDATAGLLKDIYIHQMSADPANFPDNNMAAIRRLCSERFAFLAITEDMAMRQNGSRRRSSCNLVALPEAFSETSLTYGMTKGSPYRGLFNHHINKLRDSGVLDFLRRHSWVYQSPPQVDTQPSSISFCNVVPLMAFLATIYLLATAMLLLEVALTRHRRTKDVCNKYQ